MTKFRDTGDGVNHKGGIGRPKTATNNKVSLKVKKRLVKKPGTSIRKFAKAVGVGKESVCRILQNNLNVKPYHKHSNQKMKKEHKTWRVEFAKFTSSQATVSL